MAAASIHIGPWCTAAHLTGAAQRHSASSSHTCTSVPFFCSGSLTGVPTGTVPAVPHAACRFSLANSRVFGATTTGR